MSLVGNVRDLTENGVKDMSINATETIYTNSFRIESAEFFGLWTLLSSSGSPDVKIELEMSYAPPATEGASDLNWVVPEGQSDIYTSNADKLAHVISISPATMAYGRLKITGNGTNPADTTLRARLFTQGNV